jgi:DNA-binding transcriptional regulator GbsR (MarR family)
MTQPHDSEIDQLWAKYSKDDLWKQVSEWWESASRARVVMLLAMNHKQSLSLTEMIDKAGTSEENVLKVLKELQEEGIVECHGQPATYAIADEQAFLKHMQQCCERTAVAAGMLGTLAGWASGPG